MLQCYQFTIKENVNGKTKSLALLAEPRRAWRKCKSICWMIYGYIRMAIKPKGRRELLKIQLLLNIYILCKK